MPRLTTGDLQRVLTLADHLVDVRDYGGLAHVLLAAVAAAVGSDTATMTHLDLRTRREIAVLWPPSRPLATVMATYPAHGHTHPLRGPAADSLRTGRRPPPVRISDVLSAPAWRGTALRSEVLPDVTDQMTLPLRTRGQALHALTLGRVSGTFSDRQRDVLARGSAHVRAAVARASASPAGEARAVGLQLSPHPEWVPVAHAPGLIAPGRTTAESPERQAGVTPGLSPRERDVLALVAEGMTDAQVARRLGLRAATVSRHLHRIYRRHGVSNRVAAVRLLRRA